MREAVASYVLFLRLSHVRQHMRTIGNTDDALKLAQSMKFIGLGLVKPSNKTSLDDKYIIKLIKQRDEYRIKKDFKSADGVRDKLLDMGVELRDSDGKTIWKYSED